jgi:hypothetical protein
MDEATFPDASGSDGLAPISSVRGTTAIGEFKSNP